MPKKLYLSQWIKKKIGLGEQEELTREAFDSYRLKMLQETVRHAIENGPFFQKHLRGFSPEYITCLEDIDKLPFSSPEDVVSEGLQMICVKQDDIKRIVTMETSGTTGEPKRIYFTEEDQNLTIDYFQQGMQYLCGAGERVLILLPCKTPGSVGDLLQLGLDKMDAEPVCCGPLKSEGAFKKAMRLIETQGISCIVGTPSEVRLLAEKSVKLKEAETFQNTINTVLLTGEYVPVESCEIISEAWDCGVYEHYGMTEMGLGCAVMCRPNNPDGMAFPGYHIREDDLLIEIIDPKTGQSVTGEEYGEIVFTTLTRKGMPFIRYRTGDISRWLTEPCSCGSILRRLDKVKPRGYNGK